MSLSLRQRQVLRDLGIPVWTQRHRAATGSTDPPRAEIAATAAVVHPRSHSQQGVPVAELGWEALRERVASCSVCAELSARRTQTVFGVGDPNADWLFVGEAPGAEEDRRGEPFVGRAGQLLDNMLAALGLRRGENVYIANILKCRPPGNRDPKPDEARACRAFLDRQIALIRPRVIVALGRVAVQALLNTEASLGEIRGRDLSLKGIPLVATYHPAYLLRSPADKAKVWKDLLRARAKVVLR